MNLQELVQQDIQTIADSIQKEAVAFEGQRFLLSGGAGFLGSYFVATLLHLNKTHFKKPTTITILDNYITGSKKNVLMDLNDTNVKFIEHDVRKSLPENLEADYVIHAAGLASPFYYRKFPIETIEVAVNGTKNFLEFAKNKKVKSVLYFSSSEIYGDPHPNYIPTPETYWGNVSSTGPRACYDESKRLGETLCATYHQLYNVPVKV
jgi:nucleoside-diphosphate-sugar epimerase